MQSMQPLPPLSIGIRKESLETTASVALRTISIKTRIVGVMHSLPSSVATSDAFCYRTLLHNVMYSSLLLTAVCKPSLFTVVFEI